MSQGMMIVLAIALAKLVLHCFFNNRYGYFRDEFDYLSCGDHLAWGYVDQPPLLPFLVRLSRVLLGDSLRSIRFLPALATSAVVVLSALIAREFGGRHSENVGRTPSRVRVGGHRRIGREREKRVS